jgi:hypothetical protein
LGREGAWEVAALERDGGGEVAGSWQSALRRREILRE